MRALLVCAAPFLGDPAFIANLADDHDLVIAVDGGAGLCHRAGVVPALAVGDFDSLEECEIDHLGELGVEMVRFEREKDETDLGLAVEQARLRGATSLTVTASFSERLDHSLAAIGVLMRAAYMSPAIDEPNLRGWLLDHRGRKHLALSGDRATVSVMSLASGTAVSMRGAHWSGDDIALVTLASQGVSNTIDSGPMEVVLKTGTALVLSPRDIEGRIAVKSE